MRWFWAGQISGSGEEALGGCLEAKPEAAHIRLFPSSRNKLIRSWRLLTLADQSDRVPRRR